jgi:hypothetical protein
MRLSAPTDGFIWFASIKEMVELVIPERLGEFSLRQFVTQAQEAQSSTDIDAHRTSRVRGVADRANMPLAIK